jgi:hypothetical protein
MAATTGSRINEIFEGYRRHKAGDHNRVIRNDLHASQSLRSRSEKFRYLAAFDRRAPAALQSPGAGPVPGAISIEIRQAPT